jgi:peptidoglycan/LPS O-acetylase OafA/YrhL
VRDPCGCGDLGRLIYEPQVREFCNRWLPAAAICALILAILLLDCFILPVNRLATIGTDVLLAVLVERSIHISGGLLNSRPMIFIGVLSYSLYLWQQLFFGPWWMARFPLNLVCAFAVACLSYFLIERPLLGLRRRFRSPTSASPHS